MQLGLKTPKMSSIPLKNKHKFTSCNAKLGLFLGFWWIFPAFSRLWCCLPCVDFLRFPAIFQGVAVSQLELKVLILFL